MRAFHVPVIQTALVKILLSDFGLGTLLVSTPVSLEPVVTATTHHENFPFKHGVLFNQSSLRYGMRYTTALGPIPVTCKKRVSNLVKGITLRGSLYL